MIISNMIIIRGLQKLIDGVILEGNADTHARHDKLTQGVNITISC